MIKTQLLRFKNFAALSALLLSSPLLAQTGPGGVGNATGTGGQPRVALWLRSDMGVTPGTNGLGVSLWADQSGNGNSFTQATAANQPVFTTNVINGRPILRFNGTSRFMQMGAGLNSTNALPISFFAVTNSSAAQTNPKGLFDSAPGNANTFRFYNDGSGGANVPPAGNNNSIEFWNNNPAIGGYTLNASAPTVVSAIGDLNGGNRRLTVFRDATQIGTATGNATGVNFTTPQFGRINGGDYFNADLGDAIIFNGVALNTAQRLVVENHLGAKFGRSLGANDYFSNANTVGVTGFNYDVIGIMGLNTGEKQSNSSTPDGAVNLTEDVGGLTTTGAIKCTFIGHNNTPIAATTNFMAGLAPNFTHNLGRDYWLETTGSQQYAITFDFAAAGYSCLPSNNPNDYYYIARFDQTSNYILAGIVGVPILNGTKVTFIHSTGGGSAFINIGFKSSASVVSPIVYSFNGNCAGGGCNWENSANWTTDPTGLTYIAPTICPTTARVILNGHTVSTTINGAVAPSVTINTGGRLNLGTTIGHTFTALAGGGTLSLAATSGTPTYPTVTTNTHITTAGSIMEFTSANSYTIPAPPNGAATYRNLIITGGGIKTLGQNTSAAETLLIDNATSLQVTNFNLTISGNTTINGLLLDNNTTGTTSLQNVIMNGGVIDGTNAGIYTIGGTLNITSGTNTIGQGTVTVTGITTLSAGASIDFSSTVGNKTFNNAIIVNGNWNNSGNEEFYIGHDFTVNASATILGGSVATAAYIFQGNNRNINGTAITYTLPTVRVLGTYTNSIPQLLVSNNIDVEPNGKLVNTPAIVPPYFIGFNTTRFTTWSMNATSAGVTAGNLARNTTANNGNNIALTRAGGTLYSVRTTDLQTNATPSTAAAIMVQFTLTSSGASNTNNAARIVFGQNFTDDTSTPSNANTTTSLLVDTNGGSHTLTVGSANSGSNGGTQTYVAVINATGATITYRAPNNAVGATVAANTIDIWRGNNLFADDIALNTAGLTPSDIKILYTNGTGTLTLNSLEINPITTPIISGLSGTYCTSLTAPSAVFNVNYTLPTSASSDTHFNSGTTISVQLSNAAGSFAAPVTIGSITSTATTGTISCAIPANTQGAGFRMRIVTTETPTNAGFVGADNGTNITINGYRTSPTLPQTLPVGGTGTTLSITNFSGGAPSPIPTSYQWAYRVVGSTVVNNIIGATSATYTPAPPLTSVSNTYYVFCILTSACGSSFSDAVQISVNCSVTANLLTNGNFSTLPPVAYSGTLPAGHAVPSPSWGFATQYGNPTLAVEAPATVDCNGGGGATRPCSMYPETTFAIGFNPADYHTNFCNSVFPTTNVNSAPGSATVTRTGTIEVQAGSLNTVRGTGTNFTADLVGSVVYVGAVPRQRSLITAVNVGAQRLTVSPAFTAAVAAGSDYRFMHGSKVVGGSGGYCLVGNGATGGSVNIWQQNVPVTPNRNYVLTFNAINLNGGSLAFATLFNCYQIGANIDNPGVEACNWAKYSVQWNSGSNTNVSIAIRNIGVFAGGNDITVDDIQFYECTDPVSYPPGEVFVWRGITNDWFNADNWGTCSAPTCNDDVTIPVVPTGRVYPVINANGATARSVTIDAGASLTINASRNLDVCGNWTNNGTLIPDITSTITFTSSYNPQIVSGNLSGTGSFASIIVNKTAAAQVLRFDNDVTIARDFTITLGTVNGNSRTIQVARNFTNNANGTFTANNSTVVFNGGAAQIFTNAASIAACTFYNVTANQSPLSTITLNNDLTVSNVLTLTSGRFLRGGAAGFRYVNVTNSAAASIVGYNANSYIATIPNTTDRLILRRAIANTARTYDYPVGDAINYQNARLEITSGLGAAVTYIDGFFTNQDAGGTLASGGCSYVPCTGGYWSLNPNTATLAGSAQYNVELFPVGFNCGTLVCPTTPITMAKGTYPSTWSFAGSSFTSTYKRSGFTSFTDFVPMGGVTLLPVTWVNFTAKAQQQNVVLNWTTSNELNNEYFLVQRSGDGKTFETIGKVKGAGTTARLSNYQFIDTRPMAGVSYYRLQQIDIDGKSSLSKVEVVQLQGEAAGSLRLYPNPVDNYQLYVDVPAEKGEKLLLTVHDMLGKVVYETTFEYTDEPYLVTKHLPDGVYIITVATSSKVFHEKVKYRHK